MTSDPTPTVVAGSVGKFAVGSARLPNPPTMIESWAPAFDEPAPQRLLRSPRIMLATALLGLAVVALILAGVLSSGGSGNTASPPAVPSSTPTTSSPSPTSPPTPTFAATATTPQGIVDELNTFIDNAVAAGTMNSDAAANLRSQVSDLQNSIGDDGNHDGDGNGGGHHGRLRERAAAVQSSIDELSRNDQIDQQTAAALTAIISPLTNSD